MNFQELISEYDAQLNRACNEYAAYMNTRKKGEPFTGFKVDYDTINAELVRAIQAEGFSDKQAGAIHAFAYEREHSCTSDMISFAQELCEFLNKFDDLNPRPW
jgi:hypothetical protein